MMKKQVVAMMAAAATVMSVITPMTAMAANDGPKDVQVSYQNGNVITDAKWGVVLPTAIAFTSGNQTITNAGVELVGTNGFTLSEQADNLQVNVKCKSANNMKLKVLGSNDDVSYSLTYGNKAVSETESIIAELDKTKPKEDGTARLLGEAKVKGSHVDMLTYSVEATEKQ